MTTTTPDTTIHIANNDDTAVVEREQMQQLWSEEPQSPPMDFDSDEETLFRQHGPHDTSRTSHGQ